MNWPCTLCGSRHWPDPASSCHACNHSRDRPAEEPEACLEAQESAIERFTRDGCREYTASYWWDLIDKQTNEDLYPETMAERLAWLHNEACHQAWQDLEIAPTSYAWADACALAGFDLCKNYSKERK